MHKRILILLSLVASQGFASTINWRGGFANNDMSNGLNWLGGVAPGFLDIGQFQTGTTTPSLASGVFLLEGFEFPSTLPNESFNFSIGGGSTLLFNGPGVVLDNNQQQTFSINNLSIVDFTFTSSAFSSTSTGTTPPIYHLNNGSLANFSNFSALGSAIFDLENGSSLSWNSTASTNNAVVNLSTSSSMVLSASLTIGSLSGDATTSVSYLTNNVNFFDVGTNNQNTAYAGTLTLFTGKQFNKVGTGTLTFSGVTHGAGFVNVMGGELALHGATVNGSAVSVSPGALLSGTGTVIGGSGVTVSGSIMPGTASSVGTLNFVNTPYAQGSNSTYFAKLNRFGGADLINVTGTGSTAAIGSNTTLDLSAIDSVLFGHQYRVLHADHGITGQYSTVLFPNERFLVTHVEYINGPTDLVVFFSTDFSPSANKENLCLAETLDVLAADSPSGEESDLLFALASLPDDASLNHAFYELQGFPYTYVTQVALYTDYRFSRRLFNEVRDWLRPDDFCGCLPAVQTWVSGEYGHAVVSGGHSVCKLKDNSGDVSGGVQAMLYNYCSEEILVAGVAGNYSSDNVLFTLNGGNRLQTGQGGVYAAYQCPFFYFFNDLIVGQTISNHFKRNLSIENYERRPQTNLSIFHGKYYAELGLEWEFYNQIVEPFAGASVGWYSRKRITETGGGASDLRLDAHASTYTDLMAGFHFLLDLVLLDISGDLYYQHRYGFLDNRFDLNFVDFETPCTVSSPDFGRNGIIASLHLTACRTSCYQVYLEFNGQKWERFSSYGATLGLAFNY